MSQINYHNVEVRQQETIVLEEVDLRIQKGDFVYLIGKVGSGKSSLLKTMYTSDSVSYLDYCTDV